MKNIQKYLMFNLALTIAFCTSLRILAMEPIGVSNTSSESGGELEISLQHKQILKSRSQRLNNIFANLNKQKENPDLSPQQHDYIKKLQKNIRETIEIIQNMYFGIIPVNMNAVNQRMEKIEQAVPYFG
jgi:response regulator RpfG family c-di-GMP phosphodiesterase